MIGMSIFAPLSVVGTEMNDNCQLAHRCKLNEAKCIFAKIREGQAGSHFSDEVHELIILHRAQYQGPLSIDCFKEL